MITSCKCMLDCDSFTSFGNSPQPTQEKEKEKTCHSLLYVSLLSKSVFSRSKTCEKIPCKEKNNWKSSLCYDQTLLFKPYIFNSLSFIFISIHVCLKKNAVFKSLSKTWVWNSLNIYLKIYQSFSCMLLVYQNLNFKCNIDANNKYYLILHRNSVKCNMHISEKSIHQFFF